MKRRLMGGMVIIHSAWSFDDQVNARAIAIERRSIYRPSGVQARKSICMSCMSVSYIRELRICAR